MSVRVQGNEHSGKRGAGASKGAMYKGLYINYVILFWTILDTPLPPVIMSSFDIPPLPLMTPFMYKITTKMLKII